MPHDGKLITALLVSDVAVLLLGSGSSGGKSTPYIM